MMKNRRSVSESRPIYGTARLGLQNYGFPIVKPVVERVALLEQIFDLGVDVFDTSPRYGDAESLLGGVIKRSGKSISVNTKVDGLHANDPNSKNIVYESVMRSIEILGVDQLDTLYLHQNSLDIIADKYVHEGLNRIFEEKLTRHVGASLYFQDEISYALESSLFGTIQIACNICDRRILDQCLNHASLKRIHCRSVLLQGLIANPKYSSAVLPNVAEFEIDLK